MQLTPYLFFNGNCAEACRYYEKHLGGTIEAMLSFAESPAEDPVPPERKDKIMHARLTVGDAVLMASDDPTGRYEAPQGMRVAIHIDDPGEAERIFEALADGGEVTMALAETFWAKRFGMLTDRFSTPWMVNCEPPA